MPKIPKKKQSEPVDLSDLDHMVNAAGAREPLWRGPESDHEQGGITFSLLVKWLNCRERFRLLVVEGLRREDDFNHRIEYGQMWHLCEETFARGGDIEVPLLKHCQALCQLYPTQQEQIELYYQVCKIQFPVYLNYWSKHPDVVSRYNYFSEEMFNEPYTLPSGRTVRLRGKWDSVDLIGRGNTARIYLQENKTKGDINPEQMQRQLMWDLQTMIYVVALTEYQKRYGQYRTGIEILSQDPIGGVRYNVVRRPLSGGRHTIRQKQKETRADYLARLRECIEGEPDYFFMRWKVEISRRDIERFRRQCLDPILKQLVGWWDWISQCQRLGQDPFTAGNGCHTRHPYGVYSVLNEGGSTEYDHHLDSGTMMGLERSTDLFPELKE